MASKSIRSRRARRRIAVGFDVNLTSLIDVMVIILVFLLKSYSTSTNNFTTAPGMKMPLSGSKDIPSDSVQIIITPEAITVDAERVVEFVQSSANLNSDKPNYSLRRDQVDEGGRRIVSLFDVLTQARNRAELLYEKSKTRGQDGKPLPYNGVVAITADKSVDYKMIRKIMYTAASAGFKVFRFLAISRDG